MWIKFKHWLIKKLGGYVEQEKRIITFPQPLNFTFDDGLTYETIVSSCQLNCFDEFEGDADLMAKDIISDNIGRMARRAGYIKYRMKDNTMYGELKVYLG